MTIYGQSQSWHATLVFSNATIQQAIKSLEISSMQIVLAVSNSNKLIGTLTDGDIRRAFLNGFTLDSIITEVIQKNPLVVPPEIGREHILQLMQANKIRQLPVVDHEGTVVGLHVWDSIISPSSCENYMVVMAGGRGTRLLPHTENCPKPMLDVGGKPMLEHIIERAKSDGFYNFIISLHYLGSLVEGHFGNGSRWDVNIEYLHEESPLGTAGCLSIMQRQPTLPFIVTNGDVLTDIHYNDILDFHLRHNATATMAVRQHEIQNQFGTVKIKGIEIEEFEEKPVYRSHINAGIYVLNPEALYQLKGNVHCDMPTLFNRIKQNLGLTIVYPMHEPWLDIGEPDDLAEARKMQE